MKENLRVALIQMNVGEIKEENLHTAREALKIAKKKGANLAVLPEMFCTPYDLKLFDSNGEEEGGAAWAMLRDAAVENELFVVGGSIPEKKGDQIFNTSYVFDPAGEQIAKYRKKHLFDINIEGGQHFEESKVVSPGEDIVVFDTPFGRVGLAICIDIRYPEQALEMSQQQVDYLVYPAAFNCTTGPLHWEVLFRVRALDAQAYVIGVAPARNNHASYVSWAHSLVVNPWGEVLVDLGENEAIEVVALDHGVIKKVRKEMPLGKQNL